MGLVSYYIGATPDKFATKTTHYKNIMMGEFMETTYNHFEAIEEEKEKIRRKFSRGKVGNDMSTYASYTRQACNFVFPNINSDVNGERRPRPGMFRINDEEANTIDEGKDKEKILTLKKSKEEVAEYIKVTTKFVNSFIEYLKEAHRKDKDKNHTLQDDVKNFFDKFEGSLTKMLESEKISSVLKIMNDCSPKMIAIIFNILKSPGSTLVYSNYVEMEGLQIFKVYLSFFGYTSLEGDSEFSEANLSKKTKKSGFRYVEFHGGIDKDVREIHKKLFNTKENKRGDVIKIIMISPAGAEGINLRNVRQVHIMEPYWNEVRIEQVIGRAIRQCHHSELPMDERTVDVFRYKMVRKSGKETSDEKMENISRKKNNLLISFIEAIKEAAVDCELFKAHNMMGSKYTCFKFNEDSMFDKEIGPAYSPRLDYDDKMDNGSNSIDSHKIKIKVRKIKAVKRIDDMNYSETINVWFYEPNGIVYDFEMNYPIGKINRDASGNFNKLDKDTYIIDNVINIPIFKLF